MGKVILIASGKGGVGKTVFTANIGAILAQQGNKVVLIDMNMGLRNLDICLGLESKVVYDVADVLGGLCRIKQALIRDRRFPELYLMAAAQYKQKADITPLHMKNLCDKLRNNYDYIIVDAPSGIDDGLTMAGAGADSAVIVTVPEYAAIRDADVLDKVILQMGIQERCYVVNKLKPKLFHSGMLPSLTEISENLRPKMAGIIQYDDNIHISANNGIPIVFQQGSYVRDNFTKIVKRITEL